MVLEKEKKEKKEIPKGCCAGFASGLALMSKCCEGFLGTEKSKKKPKEETEGK